MFEPKDPPAKSHQPATDLPGEMALPTAQSFPSLADALSKIEAHNQKNNFGHSLAKMILSQIDDRDDRELPGADFDPAERATSVLRNEAERQNDASDSLIATLTPIVAGLGLGVDSIPTAMQIVTGGSGFELQDLLMKVEDTALFRSYLQSLHPAHTPPAESEALQSLVRSLSGQIRTFWDDQRPDDRVLAIISVSGAMIDACDRLGIPSERLQRYATAVRERNLKELLSAEELCLDKPFSNTGFVLRWHVDIVEEGLAKEWASVIHTLHSISQRPEARALFEQASETAKAAVASAIEEVSAWPDTVDPNSFSSRNKRPFLEILRRTQLQLSEF